MTKDDVYKAPGSDLVAESEGSYEYAGFWIRVGAAIIDSVFIVLITFPLLYLVYGSEFMLSDSMVHGTWDVLISYIFPAVAVILFWLYKAATPGKMILGIKVISLGVSEKMTVGQSIGRYLGYFPSMLVVMLGVIWVAFDKKKQGWHDKFANTAVVKRR